MVATIVFLMVTQSRRRPTPCLGYASLGPGRSGRSSSGRSIWRSSAMVADDDPAGLNDHPHQMVRDSCSRLSRGRPRRSGVRRSAADPGRSAGRACRTVGRSDRRASGPIDRSRGGRRTPGRAARTTPQPVQHIAAPIKRSAAILSSGAGSTFEAIFVGCSGAPRWNETVRSYPADACCASTGAFRTISCSASSVKPASA